MEEKRPWAFESVDCIEIPVRDKVSALKWYEKHLDAVVDWEYAGGPEDCAFLTLPGLAMQFFVCPIPGDYCLRFYDPRYQGKGGFHPVFHLLVRDPWAWHFRLKNSGVQVSELSEGEDADAGFKFSDPDGNVIGISNMKDGEPLPLAESKARDRYHAKFWARVRDEPSDNLYLGSDDLPEHKNLRDS